MIRQWVLKTITNFHVIHCKSKSIIIRNRQFWVNGFVLFLLNEQILLGLMTNSFNIKLQYTYMYIQPKYWCIYFCAVTSSTFTLTYLHCSIWICSWPVSISLAHRQWSGQICWALKITYNSFCLCLKYAINLSGLIKILAMIPVLL